MFEYQLESFRLELRVRDVLAPSTSETTVYIQDDDGGYYVHVVVHCLAIAWNLLVYLMLIYHRVSDWF